MHDTAQTLVRIADALGISVEMLRVVRQLNDAMGLSLSENAELIRAFEQIEDVQVRRRIIRFVHGEAVQDRIRSTNRRFAKQPPP